MSKPPSPDSTREEAIASLLVTLLLGAVLASCEGQAQPSPRRATVTGNVAVVVVSPPEVLDCKARGWDFSYLPNGVVYRAHSGHYHIDQAVLDITPAIDTCVFANGFEVES